MKKNLFSILFLSLSITIQAQVPENCTDVMLQGFYWESQKVTSWAQLNNMAEEIAAHFDMIWLPPSAKGESFTAIGGTDNGYHPKYWSDQTSCWGSQSVLKTLIENLQNNGCKVIADIVINHRAGNTSWCNFATDNFGVYGNYQFTASHICSDDEVNSDTSAGSCYGKATGQKDSGENWCCARDLDHANSYVQDAAVAYLKWLRNEIGYDGWRYDLVKGFSPEYVAKYNNESAPYFSVGEYWDGSYILVATWLDQVKQKSAAFDFPGKYAALNDGLAQKNYAKMATNGKQSGLISSNLYKRYAVTFVDNHDTYRDDSKYIGDVQQAYAYLLSAPGVPCVFWPHWVQEKTAINKMIDARKAAGIHSQSTSIVKTTSTLYECETTGTAGSLICIIGEDDGIAPAGYELICSGDGWAYYAKITGSNINPVASEEVKAYPNPVKEVLHFEPATIKSVYLNTIDGSSFDVPVQGGTIDLSAYPGAIYFLQVVTENDQVVCIKIIKD